MDDISRLANQHRRKRPPAPPPGVKPPPLRPPHAAIAAAKAANTGVDKPPSPVQNSGVTNTTTRPSSPGRPPRGVSLPSDAVSSGGEKPRQPPPRKRPPPPKAPPPQHILDKNKTPQETELLKSNESNEPKATTHTVAIAISKHGLPMVNEDEDIGTDTKETNRYVKPGGGLSSNSSLKDELLMLSTLGQGASGIVYKSLHLPTFRIVAVKTIPVFDANKRAQMVKELNALYANMTPIHDTATANAAARASSPVGANVEEIATAAPCPFILSFYDAYVDTNSGSLSMVVEYMDGGSLQDIIDTGGCDVESVLAQISYRILKGLLFIHSHKQIHRDIKPANLLINHLGQVKVSDFGIVRDLESTQAVANTFVGTLTYMSPERISGGTYGYNSDVWSFGLSLMTCALGKYPLGTSGGYWGILNSVNDQPLPTLPKDQFSDGLIDFVNKCLSRDPAERPSVADLLNHPYLAGCEEQARQEDQREAVLIKSILESSCEETEGDVDLSHLDENALAELNEICEAVLRYRTSTILSNALPGCVDGNELPRPTADQLKNLSIQLGLPWAVVWKTFETMYGTYAEVLREGIVQLQLGELNSG